MIRVNRCIVAGGQVTLRAVRAAYATDSSLNLKSILANIIPREQKKVQDFRKQHGDTVTCQVTVDMMYSGMRGIKALVTETSVLDPEDGIRFRGHSVPECQKILPKALPDGEEPLPEGLFYLLLTGELPTQEQTAWISREWANRADLPQYVVTMLNNFPTNLHPMSQFVAAIAALDTESHFSDAYNRNISKASHWEHVYEDGMDLIAKLPTVAATIYRNLYRDSSAVGVIDPKKDWSANFASMLGFEDRDFTELLRLYLTLHSDHEGGNISAHTCHLVGSGLSNPYLAFSAGLAGLAGPLHGLANQEVLMWLTKMIDTIGTKPSKQEVTDYCKKFLAEGQVIPGFGHAVLRKTDPRYISQREFAMKHLPHDPLFNVVGIVYEVVPKILLEMGKVANPWPNVDAHSGCLLQFYGMKEMNYYTVMFGVSRALGCMASLIWDRALGLPIERPKSLSSQKLMEFAKYQPAK